MAMGKRKRHAKQASTWVATQDLPRSAAHPFYARLNQILNQHDFDGFVEGLCERFYADEGRPGLPPGHYFRLLLVIHPPEVAGDRFARSSHLPKRPPSRRASAKPAWMPFLICFPRELREPAPRIIVRPH
jgi:hypothetical protein